MNIGDMQFGHVSTRIGPKIAMNPSKQSTGSHTNKPKRPYDLVLFGATGFTGRIAANYIAGRASEEKLRWAIAGRNAKAMEEVAAELSRDSGNPDAGTYEVPDRLVADIHQPETIRRMMESATVLMNMVGPYALYAPDVVKAAVDAGTHYVDITGEPDFINETFLQYDEKAREKGVALVNACGFDSIPADLTVWHAVRGLIGSDAEDGTDAEDEVDVGHGAEVVHGADAKDQPVAVRCYVKTRARFSGGTLSTVIEALHRRAEGKKPVRIAYPKAEHAPKIARRVHRVQKVHDLDSPLKLDGWAVPMPVADVEIVRRSAMRMPDHYGNAFSYAQFFVVRNFSTVVKLGMLFGILALFVRFDGFRTWIRSKTPAGTGPSREVRAKSRFTVTTIAETPAGERKKVVMSGGDPGYDETAKMVSEAAFALLEMDRKGSLRGGVLTPAEAMAEPLTGRLSARGIRFEQEVL